MEHGADINEGLNSAVRLEDLDGVKYFVEHGAVITDDMIKYAQGHDYQDVAQYLSEHINQK